MSRNTSPPKSSPPTSPPTSLKLFIPDPNGADDPSHPSLDWTLPELFERCFVPLWIRPQALDGKTEQLYRDALKHWTKLVDNPPLHAIDDFTTAKFAEELQKLPGRKQGSTMAIATVRKHCTQIDKLLAFVGPKSRDRRGRKNIGLLELPPIVDKPAKDEEPPHGDWLMEEIQAMFRAADKMHQPELPGVKAAAWWRALIVVALYTGLRVGQLRGLRYQDVAAPFINVWARRGSKKRKGKKQYLHPDAIAEIEAIRTSRELIFEWPHNKRWLQSCLKRLARLAGIPLERQFGFHGFRKAHLTLIADQEVAGTVSPMKTAQLSAGHGDSRTTAEHYVSGRVQDKIVAAAIHKLPSPKSRPKAGDDDRQRRLFD